MNARKLGLAAFAVLFPVAAAAVHAFRTYRTERAIFYPERHAVPHVISTLGGRPAEPVSFPSRDGETMRGVWVPPSNGAAVVLVHGAGGDRTSLEPEGEALAKRGFGVLLYDLPGHGESGGRIRWGDGEQASLLGAADHVVARAGVRQLGAYGFSLGGVVVARAAAIDERFAAVVLASTPSDQATQVKRQWGALGPLTYVPALLAVKRGGLDVEVRALDLVPKIAPRPLLVVTGTVDVMVPRELSEELHRAAGEPKRLLVVEGAGHSDLAAVGGDRYLGELATFFETALGPHRR